MRLLVLIITVLFTSASYATIITFDEKTSYESQSTNSLTPLQSAGFDFLAGSAEGNSGFIEFGGARDLGGLFNANGANITMQATNGGTFDLGSFDISRREGDTSYGRSASDVVVIGNLLGGGTVEYRTGELSLAFSEIVLPNTFKDLISVIFNPEKFNSAANFDYEFVLDNINTTNSSQVSTPASLAFIILGLVAIVTGTARRNAIH